MKYIVSIGDERHEVLLEGATVQIDGEPVEARVTPVGGTPVRLVMLGDAVHRVVARRGGSKGAYTLWLDGYRFEVEALDERTHTIREMSAAAAGPAGPAPLVAPMPGLIVRVSVAVGDQVQAGQALVVMEAMKMENELRAPAAGTVKQVVAVPGAAVEKGALLIALE
jgi:pyruvate carboxylase subunit B